MMMVMLLGSGCSKIEFIIIIKSNWRNVTIGRRAFSHMYTSLSISQSISISSLVLLKPGPVPKQLLFLNTGP